MNNCVIRTSSLLVVLFFLSAFHFHDAQGADPDAQAAIDMDGFLKAVTGRHASWDKTTPLSQWDGCTLTELLYTCTWNSRGLAGPLDWGSLKLVQMKSLNLASNNLNGLIDAVALPPAMQVFAVTNNKFKGDLDLSNLPTKLSTFLVDQNELSGTIDLSKLPATIEMLYFHLNQFDSLVIGSEFNALKFLHTFYAYQNVLTGAVDFGQFPPSLMYINFNNNKLKGNIDTPKLPVALVNFHVSQNQFYGPIDFTRLPYNLQNFHVNNNAFDGVVDLSGFVPEGLLSLQLHANQFSGDINLKNLSYATGLTEILAYSNKLSGTINFAHLPSTVVTLNIQNNQFSGTLDCNALPSDLQNFHINNNDLTGTIHLTNLPANLKYFDVNVNKLHGDVNLTNLSSTLLRLYLHSNQFNGSFIQDEKFKTASSFTQLYAYDNQLTGTFDFTDVPPTIQSIHLITNKLNGTIDLTQFPTSLTALHLSINKFSGTVNLTNLPPALMYCDVDQNQLHGGLDLSHLPATLTRLYAHGNNLNGTVITQGLQNATALAYLYLYENQLTGDFDFTNLPPNIHTVHIQTNAFNNTFVNLCSLPSSVVNLYCRNNEFSGSFSIRNCSSANLETSDFANCKFYGDIDLRDGSFPKLNQLTLSNNQINGSILQENLTGVLPTLNRLHFDNNDITGSIDLTDLPSTLTHLLLQNNKINGAIDLTRLPTSLLDVHLSTNEISGPVDLTQLPQSLNLLYLFANPIVGSPEIWNLPPSLTGLQIYTTNISGILDVCFFEQKTAKPTFSYASSHVQAVLNYKNQTSGTPSGWQQINPDSLMGAVTYYWLNDLCEISGLNNTDTMMGRYACAFSDGSSDSGPLWLSRTPCRVHPTVNHSVGNFFKFNLAKAPTLRRYPETAENLTLYFNTNHLPEVTCTASPSVTQSVPLPQTLSLSNSKSHALTSSASMPRSSTLSLTPGLAQTESGSLSHTQSKPPTFTTSLTQGMLGTESKSFTTTVTHTLAGTETLSFTETQSASLGISTTASFGAISCNLTLNCTRYASNVTGNSFSGCNCTCYPGYAGSTCDTCATNFSGYPVCSLNCSTYEDVSSCNSSSQKNCFWNNLTNACEDSVDVSTAIPAAQANSTASVLPSTAVPSNASNSNASTIGNLSSVPSSTNATSTILPSVVPTTNLVTFVPQTVAPGETLPPCPAFSMSIRPSILSDAELQNASFPISLTLTLLTSSYGWAPQGSLLTSSFMFSATTDSDGSEKSSFQQKGEAHGFLVDIVPKLQSGDFSVLSAQSILLQVPHSARYAIDLPERISLSISSQALVGLLPCAGGTLYTSDSFLITSAANAPALLAAAEALAATAGSTAVGASALTGGAACIEVQLLAVIGQMSCARPIDRASSDTLLWFVSPFYSFGPFVMLFGNIGIHLGATLLHVGVGLYLKSHRKIPIKSALAAVRFPSLSFGTLFFLYVGITFATMLLLNGETVGHIVAGVFGMLYSLAVPVVMVWIVKKFIHPQGKYRRYDMFRGKKCHSRWLYPTGRWYPDVQRLQYGRLYSNYRADREFWSVLPFITILFESILSGIPATSKVACELIFGLLIGYLLIISLAMLVWRPYRAFFMTFLCVIANIFLALRILSMFLADQISRSASVHFQLMVSVLLCAIIIVRAIYTAAVMFLESKYWSKLLKPEVGLDDDDEHLLDMHAIYDRVFSESGGAEGIVKKDFTEGDLTQELEDPFLRIGAPPLQSKKKTMGGAVEDPLGFFSAESTNDPFTSLFPTANTATVQSSNPFDRLTSSSKLQEHNRALVFDDDPFSAAPSLPSRYPTAAKPIVMDDDL